MILAVSILLSLIIIVYIEEKLNKTYVLGEEWDFIRPQYIKKH
jgi:hypothetical protein